jgi:hypothetical protein
MLGQEQPTNSHLLQSNQRLRSKAACLLGLSCVGQEHLICKSRTGIHEQLVLLCQ